MISGLHGIDFLEHYVPENKMTLRKLSEETGLSEFFLFDKLGMLEKRIVSNEHPSQMALKAAKKLINVSGISPNKISFVIYASNGVYDYQFWSPASKIQSEINARNAFAFDMSSGCVSPLVALSVAEKIISGSEFEYGLIVSADAMSMCVNYKNIDSIPFFSFGDGACAILIKKNGERNKIISNFSITNGDYVDLNKIFSGGTKSFFEKNSEDFINIDVKNPRMKKLISDDLVENYILSIKKSIELAELSLSQIKYFFLNQVSSKVLEKVVNKLGLKSEKLYPTKEKFGHMTIDPFFAFECCQKEGKLNSGDYVVLAGLGVGFHWHSCVIRV